MIGRSGGIEMLCQKSVVRRACNDRLTTAPGFATGGSYGSERPFELRVEFQIFSEAAQIYRHFLDDLVSLMPVFTQRFANYSLKLGRHVRRVLRDWRRFFFNNRYNNVCWCFACKRWHAGDHFVDDDAQAPN